MAWIKGDAVAAGVARDRALWSDGPRGWYALRVAPQAEVKVESWLARFGVESFHPCLMRQVRVRGALRQYRSAFLPGYVFARFPGLPMAHRVRAQGDVHGAITLSSGEWAMIDTASMRGLLNMRDRAAALESDRAAEGARLRALKSVRAGDRALFMAGPLVGQRCEVVELTGAGAATVRLRLFGADHRAQARACDLVPLRGDGPQGG